MQNAKLFTYLCKISIHLTECCPAQKIIKHDCIYNKYFFVLVKDHPKPRDENKMNSAEHGFEPCTAVISVEVLGKSAR